MSTMSRVVACLVAATMASTSQAQTLRRLTNVGGDVQRYAWPSISADGTVIAATRFSTDGSRYVSVFVPGGITSDPLVAGGRPYVNHDGSRIFFDSLAIPLAQDECNRTGIYSIAPDGSNLQRQSLPDPMCIEGYTEPRLAEDASRILYRRGGLKELANFDGTDPESVPPTVGNDLARIDGTGERIAFSDGFNTGQVTPAGEVEIFPGESNFARADVSRDGAWLVYQRGQRLPPDFLFEEQIFVLDTLSGNAEQLTHFPGTRVRNVRISPDGIWVFFFSHLTHPELGVGPPNASFFRLNRTNGVVERVSGPFDMQWTDPDVDYDISHDGRRIVFADLVDERPVPIWEGDLLFVDLDEPSSIEVGQTGQPAVGFPHDPRASTYDVIRGDLASLSFGAGGEVDLGTVHCLAGDTPLNEAQDPPGDDTPLSGEGFFYLMRVDFAMGSLGAGTEPSYGTANPAADRLASAGDCP